MIFNSSIVPRRQLWRSMAAEVGLGGEDRRRRHGLSDLDPEADSLVWAREPGGADSAGAECLDDGALERGELGVGHNRILWLGRIRSASRASSGRDRGRRRLDLNGSHQRRL